MNISDKIKEAREKSGLTQEQVAEELLVSRQTISNWENGKTLPDIVSILNMSDLYQISLDDLLKGDHKMKEKIVKDTKQAKSNEKLMMTTGILVTLVGVVYGVSIMVGGAFREFWESALIWVLMGIGFASSMAYLSQKDY